MKRTRDILGDEEFIQSAKKEYLLRSAERAEIERVHARERRLQEELELEQARRWERELAFEAERQRDITRLEQELAALK